MEFGDLITNIITQHTEKVYSEVAKLTNENSNSAFITEPIRDSCELMCKRLAAAAVLKGVFVQCPF